MRVGWSTARTWTAGCSLLLGAPALLDAQMGAGQGEPVYLTSDQVHVQPAQAPGMRMRELSRSPGVRHYVIVFSPNDELLSGMTEFATREKVTDAHFNAIGGVSDAKLAWYDLSRKAYRVIPVTSQSEIDSITGDIAMLDGKPVVHAHGVVSDPDGRSTGGHVLEAHIRPTLEVFVDAMDAPLFKKRDPAQGLALIDPGAKQ